MKKANEKTCIIGLIIFSIIEIAFLICGLVFDVFNIISILIFITLSLITAALIISVIKKVWLQRLIFGLFVLVVGATCLSFSIIYTTAKSHGMYKIDTGMFKMYEYNQVTPDETLLPKDYYGKLILYYRYDCKDCHDTYDDINEYLEENNVEPVWVSTRSKQGKELMEKFPPSEVPTGIVVWQNDDRDEYLIRSLAVSGGDGEHGGKKPSMLDTSAMDDLINMLKTKENSR